MGRVQIALTPEEILEGIRDLSAVEQRKLAGAVANDRKLEAFIEELDDILTCDEQMKKDPLNLLRRKSFRIDELRTAATPNSKAAASTIK